MASAEVVRLPFLPLLATCQLLEGAPLETRHQRRQQGQGNRVRGWDIRPRSLWPSERRQTATWTYHSTGWFVVLVHRPLLPGESDRSLSAPRPIVLSQRGTSSICGAGPSSPGRLRNPHFCDRWHILGQTSRL